MTMLVMTLAADGPSDANLIPVIDWLMKNQFPHIDYRIEFACQTMAHGGALRERIQAALKLFPCDILLVHRDAENQAYELRHSEIDNATIDQHGYVVRIVPIRMTEAWLLSDVAAIRAAAKNRNGAEILPLPRVNQYESRPDPKDDLHAALIAACGLNARRRHKFDIFAATRRVAELTTDFSALNGLTAFSRFENELTKTINRHQQASG